MVRTFTLQTGEGGRPHRDYAAELNPEQQAVVTCPGGPMLVVAGAGSGKTRALTYRLAWLVEQGVDPNRILLMTFTNRAGREMLQRVELLLETSIRRVWGGTFHHIGNRILRLYGGLLGIDPRFTILDREDSRALMRTCVTELNLDKMGKGFPNKNVLVGIFSYMRNTLQRLDDLLNADYPEFVRHTEVLQQIFDLYTRKKTDSNVLDFDDLLGSWRRLLLEHADVAELLGEQFQHILVDEYQDTNAVQGHIVDLLAQRHRNVCVVGDDAQAIYSFRGATFENILHFQDRYPDATVFRLETNYRSRPEILELANRSIAHNRHRLPKNLRAVREPGVKPAVVPCDDPSLQGRFIAGYIQNLEQEGRRLSEMAVLYRSHWHSMEIQLELQRHNIPFEIRGGIRFFEQAHIKDLLAYVRVVHNPHDETAWLRFLPHLQGVGEKLALRVWHCVSFHDAPVTAANAAETANLLPKRVRAEFSQRMQLLAKLARMSLPGPILEKLLDGFYELYLKAQFENAKARLEDCRGLIEFAGSYEDLDAFLADVSLATEFAGDDLDGEAHAEEAVVLSTVHQAKGLEWDVVFIPWLVEGRFPVDWSKGGLDEEEEERRIFHVAVTRARNELYLTVPRTARHRGKGPQRLRPSLFVMELDRDTYEPLYLEAERHGVSGSQPSETPSQNKSRNTADTARACGDCEDYYYDYDEDDTP